MGATSSVNSHANAVLQREIGRPLDASDLKDGSEALEEVKRLRGELAALYDVDERKARKERNKWRRGSFGQLKKSDDFWEKQERERNRGSFSAEREGKESEVRRGGRGSGGSGGGEEKELNLDNLEEELAKMVGENETFLAPTPKSRTRVGGGASSSSKVGESLEEKIAGGAGSGGGGRGEEGGATGGARRRSFVLEPGLTLVDSDEEDEEEEKGAGKLS